MTDRARLLPACITAEGLDIRRWRYDDISDMNRLITASLDHLRPWMAWAQHEPLSDDRRRELFDRWDRYWASGSGAVYAVYHQEELIGGCALHRRVGPGGLDIGYWLGVDATGQGLATRIAAALTDAALALSDIDIVQISHQATNTRSANIAERLGYTNVTKATERDVTIWQRRR